MKYNLSATPSKSKGFRDASDVPRGGGECPCGQGTAKYPNTGPKRRRWGTEGVGVLS